MTLEYIGRQEGRFTWRDILGWTVTSEGPITSVRLSGELNLTISDASNRLRRLAQWGMIRRKKEDRAWKGRGNQPIRYVVTDYGAQVHENPITRKGNRGRRRK